MQTMREEAAKHANSMNAEIVQRLEASLSRLPIPDLPQTADMDDEERTLVHLWRALGEEERRSLMVLLRAAIISNNNTA